MGLGFPYYPMNTCFIGSALWLVHSIPGAQGEVRERFLRLGALPHDAGERATETRKERCLTDVVYGMLTGRGPAVVAGAGVPGVHVVAAGCSPGAWPKGW